MTSHTRPWKEKDLSEIKGLLGKYSVVAIADIENFPASLFQNIRKNLNGKVEFKVSKTRIAKKAFEGSKQEVLFGHSPNSVALLFTDMNPFELYGLLKKNRGSISAKPNVIAPEDIVIPAGDTGLPPGPALSDLKQAGLPVKIDGATISISKDTVVARAGEPISGPVASTLGKLDIKPIKVGLAMKAAYEDGTVFLSDVLDIDTDEVFGKFVNAYRSSLDLAIGVSYPSKESLPALIAKAFRDSKGLALEAGIYTKETMPDILAKADRQAKAVKSHVKDEAPEEATKEEGPKAEEGEEKKEEPAAEGGEEAPAEEGKKEEAPAGEEKAKEGDA